MSTMVEATLPADEFALNETLDRCPSAEFDILRLVANGTDHVMPFVWATADDLEALRDALATDPSTEFVEVVDELADEYLLRMEWRAHVRVIFYVLVEEDATVLDARGKNGIWRFRILFPEHESVSATNEFCEDYGVDLEFERIHPLSGSARRGQYGLSEHQYETIVRAHREGYYRVPRELNLQELAERMGVSHQALSERLRRGHGTLIENTLAPDLEPAPKP